MCDEVRVLELLSLQLDEMITLEEQAELERHLADCPACRSLAQELRQIQEALPGEEEVPADFHAKVMEAVHQTKVVPFQPKKKAQPWKPWLATAAVLALVVAGTGTLEGVFPSQQDTESVSMSTTMAVSDLAPAPEEMEETTTSTTTTTTGADLPVADIPQAGEGRMVTTEAQSDDIATAYGTFMVSDPSVMALEEMVIYLDWQEVSWPEAFVAEEAQGDTLTYMGQLEMLVGFLLENAQGETLGRYTLDLDTREIVQDLTLDFSEFIQ